MERAGFWADRIGSWLLPAALLAGVAYFTFHAFQGKYGLVARDEQLALIERLEAQRTELDREIAALEGRVKGLGEDDLDPDLLEERLRATLGYLKTNEVIILP
ncbi:septum formation initiator family protein [Neomegalonema sp.]|uniref:FtsB family cell division protein n=1 Tax=Neomegalonema sp. TaxID=2039713 RepID=UPI002605D0A3|nr:septum formation initiator family protein [Neomegalonema sp.]MDD2869137.1 septum formation initiator family protein [Neomegalonema sp.]